MIWNNFLCKFGAGSGVWCEIILGLGARSAQPFAPATKSLWYALGDYICFKIVAGGHLGLLRVNMSDIFAKGLEVRKIASAMMFFVTRRNEEKFTLSNANQDFGILLSNVRIVLRD